MSGPIKDTEAFLKAAQANPASQPQTVQGYNVKPNLTLTATDPRAQSAYVLAATSLVLYILSRILRTDLPTGVTASIVTLVPAVVGWLTAHRAYRSVPPVSITPLSPPLPTSQGKGTAA
jgi:uncharacterized membrane protein